MSPGANRAGMQNEGVGEHVRGKFHFGEGRRWNCGARAPHRLKNASTTMLVLLPDRFSERANPVGNRDPAV
jgi:hypothetical protein